MSWSLGGVGTWGDSVIICYVYVNIVRSTVSHKFVSDKYIRSTLVWLAACRCVECPCGKHTEMETIH